MKRFFREKGSKTIVIGVIGTHAGTGVTHFSIALANYISSVVAKEVIYLSMDHKKELQNFMGSEQKKFEIMGVSYLSDATSIELSEEWNNIYDYMILDMGHNYENNRTEFLRCDKKIIIGSLSPWKKQYYDTIMHSIEVEKNYKNWDYYAIFGIKEDKKEFKKKFDISIRTLPFLEDSFHIKKEQYAFFQEASFFS